MTKAAPSEPAAAQTTPRTHPEKGPAKEIRIVLADSQAIYRVGMRKVFGQEGEKRVVGQADSLKSLEQTLRETAADVVVIESGLITSAAVVLPELARLAPETKVIVQVVEIDEAATVELYRRGVRGVIPRSIAPDLLLKCVRKIAAGETWIDNRSVSWVIEAYRTHGSEPAADEKPRPRLSPKELVIISCISRGMRNREIADQVGTTEQVIKNYLRKIYDKLGVSDRLELALYCIQHHLVSKEDVEGVEKLARV